jgi:hypothetical protein
MNMTLPTTTERYTKQPFVQQSHDGARPVPSQVHLHDPDARAGKK